MYARVIKLQCDSGFYSNVHQGSVITLQPCAPSYLYLWLGNVLLAAFASAFFISNQLHLRWVVVSPHEVDTDLGRRLDFCKEPPVVVRREVVVQVLARQVRRQRVHEYRRCRRCVQR